MRNPTNPPRKPGQGKRGPTGADAKIGASIRAHRLLAGMSQDNLAQRLGVSFQQIQKYEKGTNRVGAGRLPQIAEIFGVPVGAFFSGSAPGEAGSVPAMLVVDTPSVKLLRSFATISDTAIRRNISDLVERIATTAKARPDRKPPPPDNKKPRGRKK